MGMEGAAYSDDIEDISDSPEIICEDDENYEGMEEEEGVSLYMMMIHLHNLF